MVSPLSYGPLSTFDRTGDVRVDALLVFIDGAGYKWGTGGLGTSADVGFSFPGYGATWVSPYGVLEPLFGFSEPGTGFRPLNADEQAGVRAVAQAWGEVAAINLFETPDTSTDVGDIRVGYSAALNTQQVYAYGLTYLPYGWPPSGDIWLNPYLGNLTRPLTDPIGYFVYLHELGHAIGLSDTSDGQGISLPSGQDSWQYTIQSYYRHPTLELAIPSGPMLYDIQALQALYGPNMATRTGDDVYAFADNREFLKAIWDAGGKDTLSAANQTVNCTIDLRAGRFSSIGIDLDGGTARNNVAIAFGAAIENALGGAGRDTITGNDLANTIDGGPGADAMAGGAGDDTFLVDNLGDTVAELANAGTDLVRASVTFKLASTIEHLALEGAGAIDGTGNALANRITGNAGANILDGGGGADTLTGGAGDDLYVVDNLGDVVAEDPLGGIDTIRSTISIDLLSDFEHLQLMGTANLIGIGNELANAIVGNAGQNLLEGGAGDDTLNGLGGDDNLLGGAGNDALDGGTGADVMLGGTGSDTYLVDNTGDRVHERTSEGTDDVQASVSHALGDNVERLTLTGTAAINGTGNALANTISGNAAANVIDGGAGADTMTGGLGNDTYTVESAGDRVIEVAGGGVDTVRSAIDYALPAETENLILTGTALAGTGAALGNALTGNERANRLDGGGGADTMTGGAGDDAYVVDLLTDKVVEAANAGTDTVETGLATYSLAALANVENLVFTGTGPFAGTGNSLANSIKGGSAADTLDGGKGGDTLRGLGGDDTYVVDNLLDMIEEAAGQGTDSTLSNVSYTLGAAASVEILTLTGSAAIDGTGNALANTINGNVAANVIDGGAGADLMTGGLGNDTYLVDNPGDQVVEAAQGGVDTVRSAIGYALPVETENLALTGMALDGTGNDVANALTGNELANRLDGGAGADTMTGGAGDDTYVVDLPTDKVVEAAGAGSDTIVTALASYSLAAIASVENLVSTGAGAFNGIGNALANELGGGSSNDTLDGAAGADTLRGSGGDDTYILDDPGDAVLENAGGGTDTVRASFTASLAVFANVENLTLAGTAAINAVGNDGINELRGNGAANLLEGRGGVDALFGEAGNDTLDGGAGADVMAGGAGNDLYILDSATDVVAEAAGAGVDTVRTSVGLTLVENVENAELAALAGDLNLTGNPLANQFTGNGGRNVLASGPGNDTLAGGAGNDVLDGGDGADRMLGGAGDDTYRAGTGDTIVELPGEGVDTIETSLATFSLALAAYANIENLRYTGSGATFTATGNALDNQIQGGSGNDMLDGRVGADLMRGGAGDDTYFVEALGDVVEENAAGGTDKVNSAVSFVLTENLENLSLTGSGQIDGTGNDLANVISGNSAANVIIGGLGADVLSGGGGRDLFIYASAADSVGADADRILDFTSLVDAIDLASVDGNSLVDGRQSFTFLGLADSGTAGELWFTGGPAAFLQGNTDADAEVEFEIALGSHAVSEFDLLL